MASDITVTAVGGDAATLHAAIDQAFAVFADVEQQCTRFDPSSALMRANASCSEWVRVPDRCFAALEAAASAYDRTLGRFDPRVHDDLRRLGYTRSLAFETTRVDVETDTDVTRRAELPPWTPQFDSPAGRVHLGGARVDLGGIGKGLAIRWAVEALRAFTPDFLIDAGGDCFAAGRAPDGDLWRIGVEDPHGGEEPIAVLAVSDRAVATSSTRIRQWTAGKVPVHHLIDPRTGLPGGAGLAAVTVVSADPAEAEVDTKSLFLEGRAGIGALTAAKNVAACWVAEDGRADFAASVLPYLIWQRP
jgi:thiamine biosynthesis lipoprotein